MDEAASASVRWMFSSPGMPKTYVTPSCLQAADDQVGDALVGVLVGGLGHGCRA